MGSADNHPIKDVEFKSAGVLKPLSTNSGSLPMTNSILLRGLAVVYLIAFASLLPQIHGLIGAHGILPVSSFFDQVHHQLGFAGYWMLPSLVWIHPTDATRLGVATGDLVRICDLNGTEFARGIARFASKEIQEHQLSRTEVVHRDDLVIL